MQGKLYLIAEEELWREKSCGGRGDGEGEGKSRGRGGERKNKKNIYGINSAIIMKTVNCGELEIRGVYGIWVEGRSSGPAQIWRG